MRASIRGRATAAFTLIELLLVMVVILILVGIVIALAGPAQTRAARARATAEIEALRNGLERYKVDNAVYPSDANSTDKLDPRNAFDPTSNSNYVNASKVLYASLTGQAATNPVFPPTPQAGAKIYFEQFKPTMLRATNPSGDLSQGVAYVRDPWGSCYGYSTAYQAELDKGSNQPGYGYSPGYDLWSVAGRATTLKGPISNESGQTQWIKTW